MREFNGSNQYLTLSGLSVGGADFSIACTVQTDANGAPTTGKGMMSSAGSAGWFLHIGGSPNYAITFYTATGSSTPNTATNYRVVGTYEHSTTTCRLYIDGTLINTVSTTAISSASGIDIGRRGDGIYWDGGISEVGIWSSVLSLSDALGYAAGASPSMIRPSALSAYLPLLDNDGDEDRWGGYSVTATNAPTYRDHPRVFYPHNPLTAAAASSPPAPSTSNNLLLMGVG